MVRITVVDLEQWDILLPKAMTLMADNWQETGFDFAFEPSLDMYRNALKMGAMFALAATDGEELIGYCTMFLSKHMHNPSMVFAANDALFVTPNRRGIVGARLIRAAESESKNRGASRVLWHTRAGTGLARTLERRGYRPADVVVMKEI